MENTRFDGLAKEVARSRSRRQVLRGLAVGSGIGAVALLGLKGEAQAVSTCGKHGDLCTGDPGTTGSCCGGLVCVGVCRPPKRERRRR